MMKRARLTRTGSRARSAAPIDVRRVAEPEGITIFIRDLAVRMVIGVHATERRKAQVLLLDIDLEIDNSRAAQTDSLNDTVDYAAVVEDLRRTLATTTYRLLERLAEFIAARLIERFCARRVWVQIAKVGILRDVGHVGVRIERTQARHAARTASLTVAAKRSRGPA